MYIKSEVEDIIFKLDIDLNDEQSKFLTTSIAQIVLAGCIDNKIREEAIEIINNDIN